MRKPVYLLFVLLLAACNKPPAPPEPLRPVKTVRISLETGETALSLPGEVRARHEAPLSFRVGGKITECKVSLGDTVRRGQTLARLEPNDYELAAQAGAAVVAEARSASDLADAELARYRSLREKGFVSVAALDQKQAAADAARARLEAMRSAHTGQSRQVNYTALTAEGNGTITLYNCNAGQVVGAGQPVLHLAQSGEKEILIHLPETELARFRSTAGFTVNLNALPDKIYKGTLRELAGAADPATRTYAARIAVKDADAAMQLGMSAIARTQSAGELAIRLPLAAVFGRDEKSLVWQVDGAGIVHATPIAIAAIEGNRVRVASGLAEGNTVVVAGANLLRDGEKVKLLP
ncbi:MAG: efflux RND transporter periplasmic adaptor subunit [Nitrosomonadales bacterium]|nr:efflux RND transporter periplasmic adaptor subunit [Nitrosomonadales bacterium]